MLATCARTQIQALNKSGSLNANMEMEFLREYGGGPSPEIAMPGAADAIQKTKLCKFYAEGRCTMGVPVQVRAQPRRAFPPGFALQVALIRV